MEHMIPSSGPGQLAGAMLAAPAWVFLGDLLSRACFHELRPGDAHSYGLQISGAATVSRQLGEASK